mgnify:FL=1
MTGLATGRERVFTPLKSNAISDVPLGGGFSGLITVVTARWWAQDTGYPTDCPRVMKMTALPHLGLTLTDTSTVLDGRFVESIVVPLSSREIATRETAAP